MTAHPTTHERRATGPAAPFDPALLAGLDEPLRRYFRHAIRDGAPLPDGVRVTMRGRTRACSAGFH